MEYLIVFPYISLNLSVFNDQLSSNLLHKLIDQLNWTLDQVFTEFQKIFIKCTLNIRPNLAPTGPFPLLLWIKRTDDGPQNNKTIRGRI